jgi:hypothetical protein
MDITSSQPTPAPAGFSTSLEAATLKPRGGDPWFGLSRSYWYDLEKRGIIRLTRLTLPGNCKPRVLLRREEAARAVAKLSQGANG